MIINKNVSLKKFNTFGLNYVADCFIHLKSVKEAQAIFNGTYSYKKPLLIIGGGSNILFTGDFRGTIIHPEIKGIKLGKEEANTVLVSAGADVSWDQFVQWCVDRGYSGVENLSLIPGSVGASVVQNIGAYGVEVKDLIEKIKAVNINDGSIRIFKNDECEFGYRSSIFKKKLKGKYLIVKVYYRLTINPILKLDYGSLNEEIKKLGEPSISNVRDAVINIRRSKLPDPDLIGNAGSFFKNPVVIDTQAMRLLKKFPEMPQYTYAPGFKKLAAGWMIDKCGWKGKRIGDAGVHDKQALVIVNHGKATGKEIYELSELVRRSVYDKFDVNLEREVEVIGVI